MGFTVVNDTYNGVNLDVMDEQDPRHSIYIMAMGSDLLEVSES